MNCRKLLPRYVGQEPVTGIGNVFRHLNPVNYTYWAPELHLKRAEKALSGGKYDVALREAKKVVSKSGQGKVYMATEQEYQALFGVNPSQRTGS